MKELVITLPTMHEGQVEAYNAYKKTKRFLFRAGRRFGKSKFLEIIAADCAIKGGKVGWFVPEVKYAAEPFMNLKAVLSPLIDTSSRVEGVIRLKRGFGLIDVWSLRDNELAGRGRSYDLVLMDEHAFNKPAVKDTWEKAIQPTLYDRGGKAVFASNTRGIDLDNHFFRLHKDIEDGKADDWIEHHSPTSANPLLPERHAGESKEAHDVRRAEEIEKIRLKNDPRIFAQEYLADWVDFSGEAFFDLQKMLVDGQPVDYPTHCDGVFATVDTATKTGKTNDGTAVCYWARTMLGFGPHQLILLDYDIVQIEGALLDVWLKGVFSNLEAYARQCRARAGSLGAMIEDKSSGMVLLQQALRHEWPAHPIDSKLTAMGKSERALSVATYVYQGLVKISRLAHEKVVVYKTDSRNHLLSQVLGFRVGDDDKNRPDDLADAFFYGISISLGNAEGW